MLDPSMGRPLLCLHALKELRHAKQQLMDAAAGKVREGLVRGTVAAAVHMARQEEALPQRIVELVRDSLKSIAQNKWKLDTALFLQNRNEEDWHGISL